MGLDDLADQIDDYICVFEGAGDLTMDTLVMLLFAAVVLVIALVFLTKFLYEKYVKKGVPATGAEPSATPTSSILLLGGGGSGGGGGGGGSGVGGKEGAGGPRLSEPKEVLASKKDLLLSQVKNGVGGGAAASFGGGPRGGGVAGGIGGGGSTIARKRISRKSPGPELSQKKRTIVAPSNINGSDMQACQWAVHLFRWLYSDLVVVNKLLQDWVGTVNAALMSYVEQHEMIVEVVRVLPESIPPNLSSILCEPTDQQNEVELMFDIEASSPVLQIKAFKSTNQKTEISHYKATVSRLKSRMSLIINFFALKGEMKVEGFPDIKIHLNSIGPLKTANAQDEKKQSDLIIELLTSSIRDVVYPIDFSIYSTCPRLMGEEPEEMMMPLDYSGYGQFDNYRGYQDDGYGAGLSTAQKKLLVKIVRADGLLACSQPFCVIEMDEPAQKHQSAAKMGPNPLWDETFLFDLSNHSTELLFEVYDSVALGGFQKFLGLGLVGIDELANGPASTQILELQPRPYETENITGTLMVEFVFIDPPSPAPRRQNMQQSFARDGTDRLATSTPGNSPTGKHPYQPSSDTSSPLKASPGNPGSPSSGNPPSIAERQKRYQTANTNRLNNSFLKPPPATGYGMNGTHDYQQSESSPASPALSSSNGSHNFSASNLLSSSAPESVSKPSDRKPRGIFGTLRNKLSLSKKSKSMDNPQYSPSSYSMGAGQIHSASSTLSRGSSMDQRSGIFPNLRGLSRKSSMSESSAISNSSGRTYIHEESTLLLETLENNVLRHYLVPLEVAVRQKTWKRKGIKLHVYNDHTFIAKHIPGGVLCHVCHRSIVRRPGKQGYECRDCMIQCHKPCHVRAPQACPNPKILSMQLLKWPF